jgi:alpha-amylase/alpha-mannosidase (GH57 family)
VAVLWHMHQPSYRDPLDGTFVLPWVRLHALKDYWGMVQILAETPEVHVTFNLVPSLLDQIETYVSGKAREAELRLGLAPADRLDESEKVYLLRAAFMAHPENLIGRFPATTRPPCAWWRPISAPTRCGTSRSSRSWPGSTWSGSARTRRCAR